MKILKNKLKFSLLSVLALMLIFLSSCENELDLDPITLQTEANTFNDPDSYKQFLAKIYGGLAINGQASNDQDIQGIDGNFSNYLRLFFTVQQLPTDESIMAWNDGTIHTIHNHVWSPANNEFLAGWYYRIYFQIGMANQFLKETTEEKLNDRGVEAALKDEIAIFREEARFMRALSYWHGLDSFGNIPFVDENDPIGNFFPDQISSTDLFNFLESELLDIENTLIAPRSNESGRVDKAGAWMLLAKLYLNAEVYTGNSRYNDALTYVNKVIGSGYSLSPNYRYQFMADNSSNGAQNEAIFSIIFDGIDNHSEGGTTYISHAASHNDWPDIMANIGVDDGWAGLRTTSAFVAKFNDISGDTDTRAIFELTGQELEIEDPFDFRQGYGITKYRNIDINGNIGSDASGQYSDIDFPVFRLADAYLMYAEIFLRGGGGDAATALVYVNDLRQRAYGDASGNITSGQLDLPFILDERSRELYWECHRRTDLIRFGQFTDQGIWPWKGGVASGKITESYRDLYSIPDAEILANPNIEQNLGYN